jgi:hypothetical protein
MRLDVDAVVGNLTARIRCVPLRKALNRGACAMRHVRWILRVLTMVIADIHRVN